MRNKLIGIFITIMVCCCLSFQKTETTPETGWYFLSEKENTGIPVADASSEDVYMVEEQPIINVKDFRKVDVKDAHFSGLKTKMLNIELNDSGKKKWSAATERMEKTGESAVFVYDNKVFSQLFVVARLQNSNASVYSPELDAAKLKAICQSINDQMKK